MFIRNFNRIVVLFTLMLQTTSNKNLSIYASTNKKNYVAPSSICGNISIGIIDGGFENLSTVAKLNKFKNPGLAKSKKHFVKAHSTRTDFFTLKVKKVFIYIQESFIKTSIYRHLIRNVIFGLSWLFWTIQLLKC